MGLEKRRKASGMGGEDLEGISISIHVELVKHG
jgi:hypothetical protein